eukprot:102414_1
MMNECQERTETISVDMDINTANMTELEQTSLTTDKDDIHSQLSDEDDDVHTGSFWGRHLNLYLAKYIVVSLLSISSKIFDIVLFAESIMIVGCYSAFISINADTGDTINICGALKGTETARFFCTFLFGFVLSLIFFCKSVKRDMENNLFGLLVTCSCLCMAPIILGTKLVCIWMRCQSIGSFAREVNALKESKSSFIPYDLQIFYGQQISIPETLLSGTALLIITIHELTIITWSLDNKTAIELRIAKIVCGFASLIFCLKDVKTLLCAGENIMQFWLKPLDCDCF